MFDTEEISTINDVCPQFEVTLAMADATGKQLDSSLFQFNGSKFVISTEDQQKAGKYALQLNAQFLDKDTDEETYEKLVFSVTVLARESALTDDSEDEPQEPAVIEQNYEPLAFTVTEISIGGRVSIEFNRDVKVPDDVDQWSSQGLGSDIIEIAYKPSN